jgi:hypothetical protein
MQGGKGMSSRRKPPKAFKHPKSPYWQCDFRIEGYRFQSSLQQLGAKCDKAVAQAELNRIWHEKLDQIERNKRTGREPMIFREAADKWWRLIGSEGQERDLEPSSIRRADSRW